MVRVILTLPLAALLWGVVLIDSNAAEIPLEPVQYVCQQGFVKSEFKRLDAIYPAYVVSGKKKGRLNADSVECLQAVNVHATNQSEWTAIDQKTSAWLDASPNSVFATLVRVNTLIGRARGLENSKRDWKEIDAVLVKAQALLTSSEKAAASDANWYQLKVEVGRMQGWSADQYVAILNKSLVKVPEAMVVYEAVSRALTARSGRVRPDLVEWMAQSAVDKTRAELGTVMYASIYADSAKWFMQLRTNPFDKGLANWGKLNASFIELKERYPSDYQIDLHAHFACMAQDREVTRALIEKIGDKVNRANWFLGPGPDWYRGTDYDRCNAWATSGLKPKTV
jgi:hypothetical protein